MSEDYVKQMNEKVTQVLRGMDNVSFVTDSNNPVLSIPTAMLALGMGCWPADEPCANILSFGVMPTDYPKIVDQSLTNLGLDDVHESSSNFVVVCDTDITFSFEVLTRVRQKSGTIMYVQLDAWRPDTNTAENNSVKIYIYEYLNGELNAHVHTFVAHDVFDWAHDLSLAIMEVRGYGVDSEMRERFARLRDAARCGRSVKKYPIMSVERLLLDSIKRLPKACIDSPKPQVLTGLYSLLDSGFYFVHDENGDLILTGCGEISIDSLIRDQHIRNRAVCEFIDHHLAYTQMGDSKIGVLYVPCNAKVQEYVQHVAFEHADCGAVLSFNHVASGSGGVQVVWNQEGAASSDDVETVVALLRDMRLVPSKEYAYSKQVKQ